MRPLHPLLRHTCCLRQAGENLGKKLLLAGEDAGEVEETMRADAPRERAADRLRAAEQKFRMAAQRVGDEQRGEVEPFGRPNAIKFRALWDEGLREEAASFTPDMEALLRKAAQQIEDAGPEDTGPAPLNYW